MVVRVLRPTAGDNMASGWNYSLFDRGADAFPSPLDVTPRKVVPYLAPPQKRQRGRAGRERGENAFPGAANRRRIVS